jgi:hypothetical protein
MAAVSIDTGMPGPEESALRMPRERWKMLAMSRRRWAEVDLAGDCRLLRTVVEEAPIMALELGHDSADQFLTDYLGLDLDLVNRVVSWLELERPTSATPLDLVDRATQAQPLARHGRPTAEEQEGKGDDGTFSRGSNSQAYLLRRLARDAPEILERVKAGEFTSARAAAIEAGILKSVPMVRLADPAKVAAKIRQHWTREQIKALCEALLE